MTTVSESQCQEFIALQDLADAMEVCIPAGSEPIIFRDFKSELYDLGENVIEDPENGADLLARVHFLGSQMILASAHWPKGDIMDVEVLKREAIQNRCAEIAGGHLANYSAERYMNVLDKTSPRDTQSYYAANRQEAFCSGGSIDAPRNQESVSLMQWHMFDKTKGEISPPGPREAFDPQHVSIERRWVSESELSTVISYDGQEVADIKDSAVLHPLGHYVPEMGETQAIKLARDIFYDGEEVTGLKPLNESSLESMIQQVEHLYEIAKESEALSSFDRYALAGVMSRLEWFKSKTPDDPTHSTSSPEASM